MKTLVTTPEPPLRVTKASQQMARPGWRRPLTMVGLAFAGLWLLAAVFGPAVAPFDPLSQDAMPLQPPSAEHLMGTDQIGRDILSRVLYGARITVPLAMVFVVSAACFGGMVGALAGYFGGVVDSVLMRIADMVFAFPAIILAMAIAAALGSSLQNAVLAAALVAWPLYARIVRSMVLGYRQREFVISARLLGAGNLRVLVREIAPNILGQVVVFAALELGNSILLLAGLSFLGLGAQPPSPEWGIMVSDGARFFHNWWVGLFPGLAIFMTVLAANFLSDSLRDRLDPKLARNVR